MIAIFALAAIVIDVDVGGRLWMKRRKRCQAFLAARKKLQVSA
jgi:hypothetical protein